MWKKIFLVGCLFMILPFQSFADTVKYAHANAPIQESNTSSRIITGMPGGAEVQVLGEHGEFYKIQYKNIIGYTGKNNLRDSMGYEEWSSNLSPNSTFLDVARDRKSFVSTTGFHYSQSNLQFPLKNSTSKAVDCSTFVCDVLYTYGEKRGISGLCQMGRFYSGAFASIGNALRSGTTCEIHGVEVSQYFELVSENNLQPGDIIVSHTSYGDGTHSGHVEIYAGNNRVYACGDVSVMDEGRSYMPFTCGLRVK